ncbi:transcriptional repressor [Acetobacter indonesiensis]|uniref:transcriptional repressor n=1 Tax=Acetobacter indonesiensis TaxID=104101 RepID=UPI001EFFBBDE|nr:transcriptional repressor [Acetobacter indonesiensis]MCG0995135.1 transcriptional repressor [Acetobacter indonesiensis]
MKSAMQPAFPDNFSPATQALLDRAEGLCTRQGARLTQQRREILGLILDAPTPVGAYDLLEQIKSPDRKPAPPTVYRALDFLLEHGLIHRIEKLSAFVACTHLLHNDHAHDCAHDHHHDDMCLHTAQFLICRSCKNVTEISTPAILDAVRATCRAEGFVIQSASVEIEGLCAACAQKRPAPAHAH